ncbi:MAG: hypothetical protein Q8Q92_00555 [bacterium]|nr:hypothetical protein [bacterium]
MQKAETHKVGLVFGSLLGLFHVVWSLLVALGWAQGFISFIFRLHMIEPVFRISVFSLTTAAMLVVVTAIIGYIFGSVAAVLWNKFVAR